MGDIQVSKILRLKPTNRHLSIVPHTRKNETSSGVVLPDDYKMDQDVYIEATVIDVADDCDNQFKKLRYGSLDDEKTIIVEQSMIQEVNLKDRVHYLVLENYIVGIYRRANED